VKMVAGKVGTSDLGIQCLYLRQFGPLTGGEREREGKS
jgi:hypothetical protein